MKNLVWVLSASLLLFSCKTDKEDVQGEKEKIVYDMYQPSEMAMLMNQIYEYNLEVKQAILNGETPTEFPEDFMKIHSAEMTDKFEHDASFQAFATMFVNAEKEVFDPHSEKDIKERFNSTVNLCISCHQTTCTGPIPRIKKLLIP